MLLMLITGVLAGAALGYVLQRAGLCFHSMFATAWTGSTRLLRGWLLGVAIAAVGLSLLYASSAFDQLNEGLAFRPVRNIVGGLLIGAGMAIGRTCASGLFYKLGAGMLGSMVGIAGWIAGELVATRVDLPGPTVLGGGTEATITGVLGVPRLLGAVVLLVVVLVICRALARREEEPSSTRGAFDGSQPSKTWTWQRTGIALGAVAVLGWVLAGAGDATFGLSTVGASASIEAGQPMWWLIAFLLGLVPGAHLAARHTGDWRARGETRVRYGQLAAGGFLLGAGGWIAGGCNLGHGVSGAAQLNVSSWVAVAAMAVGVGLTRRLLDSNVSNTR
ncbi:MAG: YeeE/YedE thiosulfate transporter family protein [Aeromicrobium sp.]